MSPQLEIEYLQDENRAKTLIIKQLTETKVATLNQNSTTGNWCCYVVIALSYCINNENKEPLIHLKNDIGSNKNFEQNKNPRNNIFTENEGIIERENGGGNKNDIRKKKDKSNKGK